MSALGFCGSLAALKNGDIKCPQTARLLPGSHHLFNHNQQSESIMSTSKDVPRLPNSSGTAPIPTNPETYHQKSDSGLPANPRLAYPTAQSASVHRERSVSFLALISQRLAAMHKHRCPLKHKHNGLVRTSPPTLPVEVRQETIRQAVLEMAVRDPLFLLVIYFIIGGWNLCRDLHKCIGYHLVFECGGMYLFPAGIECSG